MKRSERSFNVAPGPDEIAQIADRAITEIPDALRANLDGLVFRVQDFAEDSVLHDLGIDNPFDLLGLYQGVSLRDKSSFDPVPRQDQIFLYRRPILEYWCHSGESLERVVRHVIIHEVGHHFGLSDADMEHIEREADSEDAIKADRRD